MKLRPLALLIVVVLGACATPRDAVPPNVQLADLRLGATGLLSQELLLDFRIGNPNDFALPLEGLTFRLDINGQKFAEGFTDESVTVPRLGYATLPVKGTTDTLSILRQVLALGQNEEVTYRISGTAYVGELTGRRAVPYERDGALSLLPPRRGTSRNEFRTLVPR